MRDVGSKMDQHTPPQYDATHESDSDESAAASPKMAEEIHGKQMDEHQGHTDSGLRTLEEKETEGTHEDQGAGITQAGDQRHSEHGQHD